MSFSTLKTLLTTLVARKDELPDHTADNGGKRFNKDKAGAFYMVLIHDAFPNEQKHFKDKQCQAIGTCIRHLVGKYVINKKQFLEIIPLVLALQKYINGRQSQYLSDMKAAFHANKKPKTMLDEVDKVMRQSAEQKEQQAELFPSNLDVDLEAPLEFKLADVLAVIERYKKSIVHADWGIALELALGTRSIDVLDDTVMKLKVSPVDSSKVVITGHSKHRTDAAFAANMDDSITITPVGMTPVEAVDLLRKYRQPVAAQRAHIRTTFATHVKEFNGNPRKIAQFESHKLSLIYNAKLAAAAQRGFPEQALLRKNEKSKNLTSHFMRALHGNAAYALFGQGRSMDVFLRDRLQHAGFGSIQNYKRVAINGVGNQNDQLINSQLLSQVVEQKQKYQELQDELDELRLNPPEGVERPKPKRKCPDVPAHRPIGVQTVTLKDRNDIDIVFTKFQRVMNLTELQQQQRVDSAEEMLMDQNVIVNVRNLKGLGIGQRSVNLMSSFRKAPMPGYTTKDYDREHKGPSTCI
jgi:hypothetical protein